MLSDHPTLKSILMAFMGFTFWAWSDALVKTISDYPPVFCVTVFSLTAIIIISVFAKQFGGWHDTFHKPKLGLRLLRALLLVFSNLLAFIAFANLELTKAYSLIFFAPLLAKIFSVFLLKEQIRLQSWALSLLGFAGVLVVLRPGWIPLDIGSMAALGLTVFFALAFVMTRYIGEENQTALSMIFFQFAIAIALFGPVAVFFYWPENIEMSALGIMVLIGILSVGGHLFVSQAYARGSTAYIAPVHYSQILWGATLGWFFFNEIPDIYTLIGGSVIIGAGLLLIRTARKI